MKGIRSSKGAVWSLFVLATTMSLLILGALAVDCGHMLVVKNQLQNACDAAALAGALDLVPAANEAYTNAISTAALNVADGRAVSNSSPDCNVSVSVAYPSPAKAGSVKVECSMKIQHLLAPIIGRNSDWVSAQATAGTWSKSACVYANELFPLAVSIDAVPNSKGVKGTALADKKVGDMVDFYINSQQVKNAAFTSLSSEPTNASWLNAAIAQALDIDPKVDGFIPAVKVGDKIDLINGVAGQKKLASDILLSALTQPNRILILPIISGDPPFNQSREVLGFLPVKVQSVDVGEKGGVVEVIHAVITQAQVSGYSGPLGTTGNTVTDNTLKNISTGPIQLID